MSNQANHYWWMFISHDWKVKAVHTRIEPAINSLTLEVVENVGRAKTDILYVCDCGKVKTKTVRGTWKLDEVHP